MTTRCATSIGRENDHPAGPPIKDQLAYVEEERSGYFKWETYREHEHM